MADFNTALEALGQGKVSLEALCSQLDNLLNQNPAHATQLLAHLDKAHENKVIDDKAYAELKRRINQFRRAHAPQTESGAGTAGDSTVFARDDDFADPGAGAGSPHEKTVVTSDEELSEAEREQIAEEMRSSTDTGGGTTGVDFDLMTEQDSISNITGGTGPAGTEWSDPGQQQDATAELKTGGVIKQRFKLLEVLGVGGMGKVYKGIDLLKQEARDKNPYVAIKLLNEDFKSHPEAFISLQRESSRQQKLAHPNIATVYDFDRVGGPGTPVYITMELMEGQPLNTFIKKEVKKRGGLPFDEAFEIIRQLGAALSYAHERRLVHSDFKPGNAFLCNDGSVKTLDFGIARAVKNPVTGEAEKTLFDPGKLGALTPAYASLEMLEGEEPDTRDDIYALGCVAYELLTGKHPFNKLPANTARENGLVPAPVKGLKKKQNKALRKAVGFTREERSQTVDEFIEDLEARYIWYKSPLTVAAILVVAIGLGSIAPVMNYLEKQEVNTIISDIQGGDPATIEARLAEIRSMDTSHQLTITSEARESIQQYFSNKIASQIDTSSETYNFMEANQTLEAIARIYPDTKFLSDQTSAVASSKKLVLSELYTQFTTALKDPSLIGESSDILNIIRTRIDPEHPLLADPRPSNAYRLLAEQAFDRGDLDAALTLVASGLETAPDDVLLQDAKTRIEKAKRIAELRRDLEAVEGQLVSLEDIKAEQENIIELASLQPDLPVLFRISNTARPLVDERLNTILETGSRADAEAMASDFGNLLSALQLGRELSQIKLAHLSGAERLAAIQEIVDTDINVIEQLTAEPALSNPEWESKLLANVQELESLALEDGSITPKLESLRSTIANLYTREAERRLAEERYDIASDLIDQGERFAPANLELQNTRQQIADAKAEYERKIRVAGLKDEFKAQAEANKIAEANQIFEQLKADLPANDPFITTEAPALLSKSYEQLAQSRFEAKDYEAALKLADAGIELNPNNTSLSSARREYAVEAYIQEVGNTFANAPSLDVNDIRRKLGQIEGGNPSRYSEFRSKSINTLTERINQLRDTDLNQAAALAQSASAIFPGTSLDQLKDQIRPQPWPDAAVANAAITAGELSRAAQIQQQAADQFSGHPDFVSFSENLSTKVEEANSAYETYLTAKQVAGEDYEELRKTERLLARAQALWVDNPDYQQAEAELDKLIAANKPAPRIIQREQSIEDVTAAAESSAAAAGTGETAAAVEWKPIPSGRECEERLAGYGRRAKAICFDLVNDGWRGPLMVVVPGGEGVNNNFAISKYEISVNDWSKYCALTGRCKPVKDPDRQDDPITGISLQEAQDYVAWLSERTGKTYRLPTSSEWEYAANAGGEQPTKDFNCRVALGDKVIKGTGTVSVKSGRSNGWGLKNYVGNVQEWVLDGNSALVRGGAYTDAHSKCDISLQRPHDGGADDTTGFRIVMDEVG